MNNVIRRAIGPLLAVGLLAAALEVLRRALVAYDPAAIGAYLSDLPAHQVLLAVLCAGLSYLVMTAYDLLAMRYIRRPLAWFKVGFAAFISYAFSNTVGLSVLTSGSVRYRFYSAWGLDWQEVTQIVVFTGLTMWLGILAVGGGMLLLQPLPLPAVPFLDGIGNNVLGLAMLVLPAAYLGIGFYRRRPLKLWRWRVPVVRPGLACMQIAVGALDWVMAGTVLFVLLPPTDSLGFVYFLSVFLIAQTAGLVSHVPGGLGVFESLVLLLLSPYIPAAEVLGALLAYRVIFYLAPLGVAVLGLSVHEGWRHREHLRRLLRTLPASPVLAWARLLRLPGADTKQE